jgi:hypothetical protein
MSGKHSVLFLFGLLTLAAASSLAPPSQKAPPEASPSTGKSATKTNSASRSNLKTISRGAHKQERIEESITKRPQKKSPRSTVIEVVDGVDRSANENSQASVNRLLSNPIFSSGLSSGADAINRSIDSLMSSLFYSLLDNNLPFPLTSSAGINLGLTREVYNARNGAYVVVDKMGISPGYGRELSRFNGIPIVLGAKQSTEVFDIYLRTDPLRVAENKTLPTWRASLNNWFGILPLLELILPPSFNVNEMYDPFHRVEVPFTFPLSVETASSMDLGSIKSYSISGGINLGIDLGVAIHGFKEQVTSGPSALNLSLPFSVFRSGSYRISVLRKDANTMWVSFVDESRLGEKIELTLGKAYYLLAKTIPYWKGLAAPVFPLDFALEEAVADAFGQVYSYDLRETEAKTAFIEAVHGNFAPSEISWLRAKEDKMATGVSFFFTKKERRFQTGITTGNNIYLSNRRTARTHSDAAIEITDPSGRFHILEAVQDDRQTKWDVLTGSSEATTSLRASLFVRKVIANDKTKHNTKNHYEFIAEGNPIDIAFNLVLTDKYVEVENLNDYLETLSRFTQLKLDGIPEFPVREASSLAERRKSLYFQNDNSSNHRLHVTPTHLGRFEGYASIRLTNAQILAIAKLPRRAIWKGMCKAFGVTSLSKCLLWEKSLFWRNVYRTGFFVSQPLRIIDFRWLEADTVNEIETAVAALKLFLEAKDPEAKQSALRNLFATEYPLELVEGLLLLTDLQEVPRSVELETQAKGHASDEIKARFRKIGGLHFTSTKEFPPPMRYDNSQEINSHFEGSNLSFKGVKPIIKKLSLYSEEPQSPRSMTAPTAETSGLQLMTRVSVAQLGASKKVNVYVKLEQSGQIQLAKFKLIEDVVEIPLFEALDTPDQVNFLLALSGPNSPFTSMLMSEAISLGGSFRLSMTVSSVDRTWSDEKVLEFRVENNQLLPM